MRIDVDALAQLRLFAGVSEGNLAVLLSSAEGRTARPGETLLREGEASDHVLLVLEGDASAAIGGVVLGKVGGGDCIGEMAMMDGAPRSATIEAISEVELLTIPASAFRSFLEAEPRVSARLVANLTSRLRQSQVGWAHLAGDPDVLLGALLGLRESADPVIAARAREQAAALLDAAARRAEPPKADPFAPLTPAERRVAALVAEGLSNNEIAAQLYVSRNTVDSHVKRSYMKLGIRSRVELATLVLRSA